MRKKVGIFLIVVFLCFDAVAVVTCSVKGVIAWVILEILIYEFYKYITKPIKIDIIKTEKDV